MKSRFDCTQLPYSASAGGSVVKGILGIMAVSGVERETFLLRESLRVCFSVREAQTAPQRPTGDTFNSMELLT